MLLNFAAIPCAVCFGVWAASDNFLPHLDDSAVRQVAVQGVILWLPERIFSADNCCAVNKKFVDSFLAFALYVNCHDIDDLVSTAEGYRSLLCILCSAVSI